MTEVASPPAVAPWIAQSWQRCLEQGLQPGHTVAFDAVSTQHMRRVQEASRPLVQAAQPVLAELARREGLSGLEEFALRKAVQREKDGS